MKTNIKLKVTPEQSEAVQKICFANGIIWKQTNFNKDTNSVRHIFINQLNLTKCRITSNGYFEAHPYSEVDADLFIRTNGTCEEFIDIVDNLSNSKSKEAMFKQYGFEVPDFDCTILAKVKDKYIGYVTMSQGEIYPTYWYANGCRHIDEGNQWNLTPTKQPWYETCKFPVLVWDEDNDLFAIRTRGEYIASYLDICKPLTNSEIDQFKQDF